MLTRMRAFGILATIACTALAVALFISGCKQDEPPKTTEPAEAPTSSTSSQATSSTKAEPKAAEKPKVTTPFTPPAPDLTKYAEIIRKDIERALQAARDSQFDAKVVGRLGMYYHAYGLHQPALKCFQRCMELDPENTRWIYCEGLAHSALGQRNKAIESFENAIEINDSYGPAHTMLAEEIRESDVDRAAKLFTRAIEIDFADARAQLGLGLCRKSQGQADEALKCFQNAVKAAPDYADALGALADALEAQGKADEAAKHRTAMEDGGPAPAGNDIILADIIRLKKDPKKMARRASRMIGQKDYEAAGKLLEDALTIDPDNVPALLTQALMLLRQEKFEEAVTQFKEVLKRDSESIGARGYLAGALMSLKRLDESEKYLNEILDRRPEEPTTLVNLSSLYRMRGDWPKTIEYLRRATEAAPSAVGYQIELGKIYAQQGQLEEAVKWFQKSLRISPNDAQTNVYLGHALSSLGKTDEARQAFGQAMRLSDKIPDVYIGLSQLAKDTKDWETSVRYLEMGLERIPDSELLSNTLAWLRATCPVAELRDGAQAVELAEKACSKPPWDNHPSFLDTLAAAYAEAGRFDDATETAQRAIAAAEKAGQENPASRFRERLELYKKNTPFRDE